MILISRIRLGVIRARAQYIADYVYEGSIKAVAEAILAEIEKAEQGEGEEWQKSLKSSKMESV